MKNIILVFSLIAILFSCVESEPDTGSLAFSTFSSIQKNLEESNISGFAVTILDASGDTLYNKKTISVLSEGNSSEPILLNTGTYKLVEFLVLDQNGNAIYGAPNQNAILASLVSVSLPLEFTISADQVVNIDLDVIYLGEYTLTDLGYTSIGINIVSTFTIFVSVMEYDSAQSKVDYAKTANVSVYADGDSLYSKSVANQIHAITLPTERGSFKFDFYSDLWEVESITLSYAEAQAYKGSPLTVIIESGAGVTPKYYYSLNGSAEELNTGAYSGVIYGTTDTTDRAGNASAALYFDGNDYIDLPYDFDIEEKSISLWFNFSGDSLSDGTYVLFNTDHYGMDYGLTSMAIKVDDQTSYLVLNQGGHEDVIDSAVIQQNQWYMATVTTDAQGTSYYLNDQKFADVDKFTVSSLDGDYEAKIGSSRNGDRFFEGIIDEIKIYDSRLTDQEVQQLY